jgi:hypothetical protein
MAANKGKQTAVPKEIIQFVGLKDATPEEQETINDLSTEYFTKIKRDLPGMSDMVVHLKTYGDIEDKQKRRKYSLHVRAVDPRNVFESGKSDDWDLPRALHKSFQDIQKQIQHKLHTDVSHHKTYC